MKKQTSKPLRTLLAVLLMTTGTSAFAATHPDIGLVTTYSVESSLAFVNWVYCGTLPNGGGGCPQLGTLGPFGAVAALLEGNPATNGNVVTRHIYVLDTKSGPTKDGVTLYDYKRVDTILSDDVLTTIAPPKKALLQLIGGVGARASMAASPTYIYVGTSLGQNFAQIKKGSLAVTMIGGSPVGNVTSILTNSYGYVTVTQGSNAGISAYTVIDPNGATSATGGGNEFVLDTRNAVIPANLPLFP